MGRKPREDREVDKFSDYGKRGTSQEKSILMSLKDMVKTDGKVYYILWKYAPDLIPKNTLEHPIKTFEDLTAAYECIKPDQRICENYLMEENVQKAVKWLRSRQHTQKMFELYDKFCEKATNGDVQAFKAVLEFGDKYFSDTKEAELLKVLHNANLSRDDEEKEDDFSFIE